MVSKGSTVGPAVGLGVTLVASALLIAGALDRQSHALKGVADRPLEVSVSQGAAPRATPAAPSGTLADLGAGRVVYATPTGDLVVIRRDSTSGELEVERVYDLVRDDARHQGSRKRRAHGYYLDDVAAVRRNVLDAATKRYEAAVALSERTYTDVDQAEIAATELARAGGADTLRAYLSPDASQLRRRTAAIGLGSCGYLCSVEPLLGLLRYHGRNPKFFAELTQLLEALTGLELESAAPADVILLVEAWSLANPLTDPFARASR